MLSSDARPSLIRATVLVVLRDTNSKPAPRAFVVEENAADAKESVSLAIVSGQVKPGDFADSVGTARLKRRRLFLRHFVDVAKHLARPRESKNGTPAATRAARRARSACR